MYDFSGRIIVVTGAAKGLGYAMAERFLADNAAGVALLDINARDLEDAKKRLDPKDERTLSVVCDVGNYKSVEVAFTKVHDNFKQVDVLINNAGITRDALAVKMTPEQFDLTVQVSLNGAFYCAKQVMAGMRERGWGRIISLSSMAAEGNFGQANYAAAKAGIIGMTRTLSDELVGNGVTVNCIQPGLINTDIIETIPDNVMEKLINHIPAKRIGQPKEVADLIAFLASEQSSYISGQSIKISGGLR